MKYPNKIEKYDGSLFELAKDVGNLRYDALATFLGLLAMKIDYDSKKDLEGGRIELSGLLKDISEDLFDSQDTMSEIWELCKPYMTEENE